MSKLTLVFQHKKPIINGVANTRQLQSKRKPAMVSTSRCASNHAKGVVATVDIIVQFRRCSKCQREFPLTTEHFHFRKDTGSFYRHCILCHREMSAGAIAKWRKENPETTRERDDRNSKNYRARLGDTFRGKQRIISAKWRDNNREKVNESLRNYAHRNKDKRREIKLNKRARKLGLPHNYSAANWRFALDYFHGQCAVCGRQLNDLFRDRTAAADHWIPLSSHDCPGTIPTNIVPLCHGIDGCNNSKSNKPAAEWLTEKYGKSKAKQILARVEAYFDYIKSLVGVQS